AREVAGVPAAPRGGGARGRERAVPRLARGGRGAATRRRRVELGALRSAARPGRRPGGALGLARRAGRVGPRSFAVLAHPHALRGVGSAALLPRPAAPAP